ncbi:MAG: GTP cyclohydrolase I FolE [Candidatus Paceibacterota bacterium]|jgi:GTP cyclohydrolase I
MQDLKFLEGAAKEFLIAIGEDLDREGLLDTPKRMAKMWKEMFYGYDPKQKPKVTVFPNGKDGIVYDEMITDEGYFYSFCEHHSVTFFGNFFFGYIPGANVIGISKISRIVDYYAARLQVQERLVLDVVNDLDNILKPKGCGLVMKGRHLCKEMRGVKKRDTSTTTTALRGCFQNDIATRTEFLGRVQSENLRRY